MQRPSRKCGNSIELGDNANSFPQYYGIWGDTNGATSVGEASISLADLCFPDEDLNGNKGHDQKDVLYIGFPGSAARPGPDTKWTAGNPRDFEESIRELGDKLVAGLKA